MGTLKLTTMVGLYVLIFLCLHMKMASLGSIIRGVLAHLLGYTYLWLLLEETIDYLYKS